MPYILESAEPFIVPKFFYRKKNKEDTQELSKIFRAFIDVCISTYLDRPVYMVEEFSGFRPMKESSLAGRGRIFASDLSVVFVPNGEGQPGDMVVDYRAAYPTPGVVVEPGHCLFVGVRSGNDSDFTIAAGLAVDDLATNPPDPIAAQVLWISL